MVGTRDVGAAGGPGNGDITGGVLNVVSTGAGAAAVCGAVGTGTVATASGAGSVARNTGVGVNAGDGVTVGVVVGGGGLPTPPLALVVTVGARTGAPSGVRAAVVGVVDGAEVVGPGANAVEPICG